MTSTNDTAPKKTLRARVFAFVALTALGAAVVGAGRVGYRAATDSFVAPVVLSPESELVVAGRAKLEEVRMDRIRADADLEEIDADIAVLEQSITKLEDLKVRSNEGLAWTATMSSQQAAATQADLRALEDQRRLLTTMVDAQTARLEAAKANLERGLVARADYEREVATLGQLKLDALDNERARGRSRSLVQQLWMTTASLGGARGTPPAPELAAANEHAVRVELELSRTKAELRGRRAQRKVAEQRRVRASTLETQLAERPIFRALEHRVDLAYVPYTQLDGVTPGATVLSCTWGLFSCRPVGRVAELVDGEVSQPDPWGHVSRGQLAVLELDDPSAARKRTLRVRGGGSPGRTATPTGDRISAR
ncbi:MAG: hypothetical protein JNL38_20905 [Myxococcales bacterium]|jgi:hypothetical protein|nr:hypothetical protein [Myxococcales bacterium]